MNDVKFTCPFCQHETTTNPCSYCHKLSTDADNNPLSSLVYQLKLALVVKDYPHIIDLSEKILASKESKITTFYLEYAKSKVNYEPFHFNFKALNEEELKEAYFYLKRNNEDVSMLPVTVKDFDQDELEELLPLVSLREKPVTKQNPHIGRDLFIYGAITMVIAIVIGLLVPFALRSPVTIILSLIPSLIFTQALGTIYKPFRTLKEIVFLVVFILISYLALIYLEANPLKHLERIVFSPYDLLEYWLERI